MAKKASSRKNRSAGSWKKRSGCRPGLGVDPLLGVVTWLTGPAGLPHSSTVSDPGFFGRPKSLSRPLGFNKAKEFTGGMDFPEAETVAVRDGRYIVVPVEHDDHRAKASAERKAERAERYKAQHQAERETAKAIVRLLRQGFDLDDAKEIHTRAALAAETYANPTPRPNTDPVRPEWVDVIINLPEPIPSPPVSAPIGRKAYAAPGAKEQTERFWADIKRCREVLAKLASSDT